MSKPLRAKCGKCGKKRNTKYMYLYMSNVKNWGNNKYNDVYRCNGSWKKLYKDKC